MRFVIVVERGERERERESTCTYIPITRRIVRQRCLKNDVDDGRDDQFRESGAAASAGTLVTLRFSFYNLYSIVFGFDYVPTNEVCWYCCYVQPRTMSVLLITFQLAVLPCTAIAIRAGDASSMGTAAARRTYVRCINSL